MNGLPVAVGFFGIALLSSALTCRVLRGRRMKLGARAAVALGGAAWIFLPAGDLLIVEYIRSALGDLSITAQVLLAASVASYVANKKMIDERDFTAIMFTLAAIAIFLYPLALGLTNFDPYALGFGSPYFTTVLLVATVAAWWARLHWIVACVILALAGYLLRVLESDNLWDYLIDAAVAIYALGWVSVRLFNRFFPSTGRRGVFSALSQVFRRRGKAAVNTARRSRA